MTAKELRKLCMSLPGATETIQWGDDRVFKIGGKPAPYLARAKWVQIDPAHCELADKDLRNVVGTFLIKCSKYI